MVVKTCEKKYWIAWVIKKSFCLELGAIKWPKIRNGWKRLLLGNSTVKKVWACPSVFQPKLIHQSDMCAVYKKHFAGNNILKHVTIPHCPQNIILKPLSFVGWHSPTPPASSFASPLPSFHSSSSHNHLASRLYLILFHSGLLHMLFPEIQALFPQPLRPRLLRFHAFHVHWL